MNVLRRMPKSTNMRIDYLDEMTTPSITARTFDSHSDAGNIDSTSRRSSAASMVDELQEVAEIEPSNRAPVVYDDLLQYTNRGGILPTLHGFPYISVVSVADMPRRTSTDTTSTTTSTHSTNSSIQSEGAFFVSRLSSTSSILSASSPAVTEVDPSRPPTITSNSQQEVVQARTHTTSSTSRISPSSSFSEHTHLPACGCRALITALRASFSRRRKNPQARDVSIYPQSSGRHGRAHYPTCASASTHSVPAERGHLTHRRDPHGCSRPSVGRPWTCQTSSRGCSLSST